MRSSGKRKAASSLDEVDAWKEEHSPLWLLLLQNFSLGKLSAADVQALANAACLSGSNATDLLGLAALGAHGNSSQNCHRDLVRKHFSNLASPLPTEVKCNLQCRNADGLLAAAALSVPVLLPHQWVQALDEHFGNIIYRVL